VLELGSLMEVGASTFYGKVVVKNETPKIHVLL
jgi:hypothetical protein